MNDVSRIIYFSDILPNFQVLIVCLAFLLTVVLIIRLIIIAPEAHCPLEERRDRMKKAKRTFCKHLPIILLIFALGAFIPSRSTLLMIAASQASEKIVASNQGQSLINSLNDVLKEKIKP